MTQGSNFSIFIDEQPTYRIRITRTVSLNTMKPFWISLAVFGLLFAILFSFRLDLFNRWHTHPKDLSFSSANSLPEKDSWMNIFQHGRKIGSSQTTFSKTAKGYHLKENIYMRINTMGLVQDINLKTGGNLNPDFSLASFVFEISSGRFSFGAQGTVTGDLLAVQTRSFGTSRKINLKIKEKIYIIPGILKAVTASDTEPGDEFAFQIFDPATMGRETVVVRIIGFEEIPIMGRRQKSTKVSLSFKGLTQLAWIGPTGQVLKEKGLLGITLEKTTRDDALFGLPTEASQDLTRVASVPSNMIFNDTNAMTSLVVAIDGINFGGVYLHGGRQRLAKNVLTIKKEVLSELPSTLDLNQITDVEKQFLRPTPFIQSDHARIRKLANQIVSPDDAPLDKASKLVAWVHQNIEKRPVLSLPDALSTLENRMGDCNEHAVLLAALARAAGIPVKVEAGLVYLKGRFYYHAWNLLYLGRWLTADALFGQIPADVTHIRFSSGDQRQQLDLMHIMGKIRLTVVTYR